MKTTLKTFLVLLLASALLFSGSSTAMAIGVGSGSGNADGTTTPTPGGSSTVTAPPPTWRWVTTDITSSPGSYGYLPFICSETRAGDGAPLLSARIRYKVDIESGKSLPGTQEMLCAYPPSSTLTNITCVVSSQASVEMIAPRRETLVSRQVNTSFASDPSVENCRVSGSAVSVNAVPSSYGRYQAYADSTVQYCQVRTWGREATTGITAPEELVNCGAPRSVNPGSARGELSCNGWIDSWSGRTDWSETSCGSETTTEATYQCQIPAPEAQKEALRDGNDIPVSFGAPGLSGGAIRAVGAGTTNLSAPMAAGGPSQRVADVLRGSQSALKPQGESTGWLQGIHTDWTAVMYTAGTMTLTAQYQWDVTVAKTGVRFVSIDPKTSAWTTEATEVLVETTARCSDSVSIDGLRVVNY